MSCDKKLFWKVIRLTEYYTLGHFIANQTRRRLDWWISYEMTIRVMSFIYVVYYSDENFSRLMTSVGEELAVLFCYQLFLIVVSVCYMFIIPAFHWTAIPVRFETLVRILRIVAETTRAQHKSSRSALVVVMIATSRRLFWLCSKFTYRHRRGLEEQQKRSHIVARTSWA